MAPRLTNSISRLNAAARRQVQLTLLRPPSFEQLSRILHEAKAQGWPFHLVHFDGHGLYADPESLPAQLGALDALHLGAGRRGPQDFLLFENPNSEHNSDLVTGSRIGRLLQNVKAYKSWRLDQGWQCRRSV